MIDRILTILADNPAGLTDRQLMAALGVEAWPAEASDLVADGRVALDTTTGVSVYRTGKPKEDVPKPKAAPTSRMVPIALLDALAEAHALPKGSPVAEIVEAAQAQTANVVRLENLVEADGTRSAASTNCTAQTWDRAGDGQWARCLRTSGHDGDHTDGCMEWPDAPATTTPALPSGWRARYERTTPSGVDLAVVPDGDGWSWSIIDGAQTLGRGVVEVDDAAKAIGCCDAVAAVLHA